MGWKGKIKVLDMQHETSDVLESNVRWRAALLTISVCALHCNIWITNLQIKNSYRFKFQD